MRFTKTVKAICLFIPILLIASISYLIILGRRILSFLKVAFFSFYKTDEMQYLLIFTQNLEAFRIPFSQIEEFRLENITETVTMGIDRELLTNKDVGFVSISLCASANYSFPYSEGDDLFKRLISFKDIISLSVFSASANATAAELYVAEQRIDVSYFVPWSNDHEYKNSLANITLKENGSLSIIISKELQI